MDISPLKTEADYQATLKEIETLMHAAADTFEGERLDALVTRVEAYETMHDRSAPVGWGEPANPNTAPPP